MKRSPVGEHPDGLKSSVTEVNIDWSGSASKPIKQISINHVFSSQKSTLEITRKLQLIECHSCNSLDEFDNLLLPIPDGQKVHSLDPEYKSLALAYKGGDIVRQADGAPLEQVIQERTSRRKWLSRATYAGGALLTTALLYVGYRLIRRRRAKAGGA